MNLPELITKARENYPSDAALARVLNIDPVLLNMAKKGKRPLPLAACGRLGEVLGIERFEVAAASDLITEKNEQRRAYLLPFVRHAAGIMGLAILAGAALPSSSEAAPLSHKTALPYSPMYIMSNRRKRKARTLLFKFLQLMSFNWGYAIPA